MAENQIVFIKKSKTKTGSPMWKCWCSKDNLWVNVFKDHEVRALVQAGYREILDMQPEQELHWKQHPITITVYQNGEWWNLDSVEPRPEGAIPDPVYTPDLKWYAETARRTAQRLIEGGVFFDTETDGVTNFSRIIAINLSAAKVALFDTMIKPPDLTEVANTTHVHGITPESLENCPDFNTVSPKVYGYLNDEIWVAWNAKFDLGQIEREFMRANLPLPFCCGLYDAMVIYAWAKGLWNEVRQEWEPVKLTEAAQSFGITVDVAHHADADVVTMIKVIRAIANRE